MDIDIHWIIERLHRDGAWEAVQSGPWLAHTRGRSWADPLIAPNPRLAPTDGSRHLFGLLSGVRCQVVGQVRPLAREDLPEDASEHSKAALGWSTGLHTPGWVTLGDLRAGSADPEVAPSPADSAELKRWLDLLTVLIQGSAAIDLTDILEGPVGEPGTGRPFPAMQDRSSHEKLARRKRADGFLPLSDDTLRVIFAYDG